MATRARANAHRRWLDGRHTGIKLISIQYPRITGFAPQRKRRIARSIRRAKIALTLGSLAHGAAVASAESAFMASTDKKTYLLRIDAGLWAEVERLAAQELRSANAQVEYLLRDALARRGRDTTRSRASSPAGAKDTKR
jgi:hypothetical protein